MPETAIKIVRKFWETMQTNDFRAASQCLSDGYVLEWPQSRERLRGRDNFARMNAEYPVHGRWQFTINKIVGNENEAVSDVSVTDGAVRARVITFSTIRDGEIVSQVEFWPEDYSAPENRRHLVEIMSL
jgi:ketosteroid isomerase-like protein